MFPGRVPMCGSMLYISFYKGQLLHWKESVLFICGILVYGYNFIYLVRPFLSIINFHTNSLSGKWRKTGWQETPSLLRTLIYEVKLSLWWWGKITRLSMEANNAHGKIDQDALLIFYPLVMRERLMKNKHRCFYYYETLYFLQLPMNIFGQHEDSKNMRIRFQWCSHAISCVVEAEASQGVFHYGRCLVEYDSLKTLVSFQHESFLTRSTGFSSLTK